MKFMICVKNCQLSKKQQRAKLQQLLIRPQTFDTRLSLKERLTVLVDINQMATLNQLPL